MVKIEARLSGSQPMTINWYKDDSEIHSSDHYDMSFKSNVAVLCIKSSKVSDCGRYTVTATNEAGTASCKLTVTITGRSILLFVYSVVFLHRKLDINNGCLHYHMPCMFFHDSSLLIQNTRSPLHLNPLSNLSR